MTQIKGVYGAVDDTLAAWRNDIEDIRAMLWSAFGRVQGVRRGFVMSLDVGALSVTFTPGEAIIEQRGTDITGDARCYFVYNDVNTTVTFGAPSASSRNDALVFCWGDRQYGALGASVPSPGGPQIVVVPGVSGSTTPRTDAQIQTAINVGGWFRFADVIIAPGNTSVQPGNVTLANVDTNDFPGARTFKFTTATISTPTAGAFGNVTGFTFPAIAGRSYAIECTMFIDHPSSSLVDWRSGWSWTGAGAMSSGQSGLDTTVSSPSYNGTNTAHALVNAGASPSDEGTGLGTPSAIPVLARVSATYVCSGSGTVQMRHAQMVADAVASRVLHGSRMIVTQLN